LFIFALARTVKDDINPSRQFHTFLLS